MHLPASRANEAEKACSAARGSEDGGWVGGGKSRSGGSGGGGKNELSKSIQAVCVDGLQSMYSCLQQVQHGTAESRGGAGAGMLLCVLMPILHPTICVSSCLYYILLYMCP